MPPSAHSSIVRTPFQSLFSAFTLNQFPGRLWRKTQRLLSVQRFGPIQEGSGAFRTAEVETVEYRGWKGLENGALLRTTPAPRVDSIPPFPYPCASIFHTY